MTYCSCFLLFRLVSLKASPLERSVQFFASKLNSVFCTVFILTVKLAAY